jgi:hypothetical protein
MRRIMSYESASVISAAEYLDEYCEFGNWRDKVNLKTLRMSSMTDCILGQVYGDYNVAEAVLNRASSDDEWDNVSEAFESFQDAWIEYLKPFQKDSLVTGSEWIYQNINGQNPVRLHHTVMLGTVNYVVFSHVGQEMQIRTEAAFRKTFKPKPEIVYVEGQLYIGKDKAVLMYGAKIYYGKPGFYYLNDTLYGSLEYFEKEHGPLKPIEAVKNDGKPVIAKIG